MSAQPTLQLQPRGEATDPDADRGHNPKSTLCPEPVFLHAASMSALQVGLVDGADGTAAQSSQAAASSVLEGAALEPGSSGNFGPSTHGLKEAVAHASPAVSQRKCARGRLPIGQAVEGELHYVEHAALSWVACLSRLWFRMGCASVSCQHSCFEPSSHPGLKSCPGPHPGIHAMRVLICVSGTKTANWGKLRS